MTVLALFGLSIIASFVASGIVAWLFLWPWLRAMPSADALLRLLVPHTFRFVGLSFLVPGVVSPTLSPAFAAPVAYGDLIAAVLAIAALLSLRCGPSGRSRSSGCSMCGVPPIFSTRTIRVRSVSASILARSARPSSSRPCWCPAAYHSRAYFPVTAAAGSTLTSPLRLGGRQSLSARAGKARTRGPGSGRALRAARAEPAPLFPGSGSRPRPSVNRTPAVKLPFLRAGNLGARPPPSPHRRCISERQELPLSGHSQ